MTFGEFAESDLKRSLSIVLSGAGVISGKQQENRFYVASVQVVIETLQRFLVPDRDVFLGESAAVGAWDHILFHAIVGSARPVLDDQVVERDAANPVFQLHSGCELIFGFGITIDEMAQSALIEAVAYDYKIGMNSLIPKIEKLLPDKGNGIAIHTAVQHGKAVRKITVQCLLQFRRVGMPVVDSVSVGYRVAEAKD